MNTGVLATFGAAVRGLRARIDRALHERGLRLGQYHVLRLLWERDGMTPRELAAELEVEMPTVTRTVQRMVRDGLVRRQAHPHDARSVCIYCSDRGRAFQSEVQRILDRETEAALQGFSASERAQFTAFLERINANVRGGSSAGRHD